MRRESTLAAAALVTALIVCAQAGSSQAAARQDSSRFEFTEVHMGMPVRIALHAEGEVAARAAAGAAFARIAALDSALSDYRPDSELNRLSASSGRWVAVSPDLLAILEKAQRIAARTGGTFDPTVGPLVALWREARRAGRLPDVDEVARARARVGWRLLDLDPARRAARLAASGMRLDLGGIAKGFILDEALLVLRAHGIGQALLEAGGDIVAGDPPPGRTGWRVDVPGATGAFAARASMLANAALATSGPSAQFVEIGGVRYSHVVDPATGIGLTRAATVHVMAPDGATADALATAIGVLGLDCAAHVLGAFPDVLAVEIGAGDCQF